MKIINSRKTSYTARKVHSSSQGKASTSHPVRSFHSPNHLVPNLLKKKKKKELQGYPLGKMMLRVVTTEDLPPLGAVGSGWAGGGGKLGPG